MELGNLKTLQVARPPLTAFERALKRTFDIVVATVRTNFYSRRFWRSLRLAIKLESRGPVFFWQRRHGYNNTIINVIKFRTMVASQEMRKLCSGETERRTCNPHRPNSPPYRTSTNFLSYLTC